MNYLKNKLSTNKIALNYFITLLHLITYYTIKFDNIYYFIKSLLIILIYLAIDLITHILINKSKNYINNNYSIINAIILVLLIDYNMKIIYIVFSIIISILIKYILQLIFKKEIIQLVLINLFILNLLTNINYNIFNDLVIIILMIINYFYLIITKSIKFENMIIYIFILLCNNIEINNILLILGLYILSYNQTTPLYKYYNYIYSFIISILVVITNNDFTILILLLILMNIVSKFFDYIELKRR